MRRLMCWLSKHEMKLIVAAILTGMPPLLLAENPAQLPQAPAMAILWVTASLLSLLRAFLPDETKG
jgi:hypothetical protein